MRGVCLQVRTLDVPGGEILAPLAAVQLGGLIIATIAALIVIPAAGMATSARSVTLTA